MKIERFLGTIDSDFYTGVPDSQLKALCNYLIDSYGTDPRHHVIAANEGNAVAIAAGYHLATGKVPVVYMQNSGEGNGINPMASLLNKKVYAIPTVFIIGWRGEPGVHDEPQHIFQGEITTKILEVMETEYFIVSKETESYEIEKTMDTFRKELKKGNSVAFVIKKDALDFGRKVEYKNNHFMRREEIIEHITAVSGDDPVICTTGKASRELFEIREREGAVHAADFLTVGSMGHCSSIALGVALHKPNTRVWCIDGDGAVLMHMGALAVIGSIRPKNLIHIVINNGAHETVGGQPTAAGAVDLVLAAKACGYPCSISADTFDDLDEALKKAKETDGLCFIEVKCGIGARDDLGRPTVVAVENKNNFMKYLSFKF